MPLDLYYTIASPPCRSVMMLAKYLGLELNLIPLNLMQKEHLTPEFLKLNPQHTVPTLVDNGYGVWESRAILGYLAQQYAKDDALYPKDPKKRAFVDQRLYFDACTLFPKLKAYFHSHKEENGPNKQMGEEFADAMKLVDSFLEGQDWIAGDRFTIADIAFLASVSIFEVIDYDISQHKNISKWYPKAKKQIVGYDDIQNEASAALRKMIGK